MVHTLPALVALARLGDQAKWLKSHGLLGRTASILEKGSGMDEMGYVQQSLAHQSFGSLVSPHIELY